MVPSTVERVPQHTAEHINEEIRRRSGDRYSIDNVFRPLVGRSNVSTEDLKAAAAKLLGGPSKVLQDAVVGE